MNIDGYLNKIDERDYTVGIIGLGYVGLPLMWTFHQAGIPVLGFDVDSKKIDCIREGKPYIKHLGEEMMQTLAKSDICDATADFSRLREADALLMCVPTPLDHHREPDMRFVRQTTETIAKHLRKGQLVILESTTWPGTTEELTAVLKEVVTEVRALRVQIASKIPTDEPVYGQSKPNDFDDEDLIENANLDNGPVEFERGPANYENPSKNNPANAPYPRPEDIL